MAARDAAARTVPEDAPSGEDAVAAGPDGAANDARVGGTPSETSPVDARSADARSVAARSIDAADSAVRPRSGSATAPERRAGSEDAPGVDASDRPSSDPGDAAPADLAPERPNRVSRTVEEIVRLLDEIDDAREELVARGVQYQTLNVLVEFGFHEREEGRETLVASALAAARETYGAGAIDREELERRLVALVSLERDVAHTRRLARQQGFDLQALNFLAQIVRKNPGDGGELAVNTFLGYALACGIPLERIADIAQRFGGKQGSVLPDIERRAAESADRWPVGELARDAALGLCLGLGILWLLV